MESDVVVQRRLEGGRVVHRAEEVHHLQSHRVAVRVHDVSVYVENGDRKHDGEDQSDDPSRRQIGELRSDLGLVSRLRQVLLLLLIRVHRGHRLKLLFLVVLGRLRLRLWMRPVRVSRKFIAFRIW